MAEKRTQHEDILNYLQKRGTITPWQAFTDLGITKLATRIGELKRAGYDIRGEMVDVRARNGRETKVMRYWLFDEEAASWIENEIRRVDKILAETTSKCLWNDMTKYRGRLIKRLRKATNKWK